MLLATLRLAERLAIGKAQDPLLGSELPAQDPAQSAGGAGQEHTFHRSWFPSRFDPSRPGRSGGLKVRRFREDVLESAGKGLRPAGQQPELAADREQEVEIGRASGRERVGPTV